MSGAAKASSSPSPSVKKKEQLSDQEITQRYQQQKNELQGLAQKIGELESEADEHALVVETLTEAQKADPNRKCFRMIGGVLVERTAKEVLPALQTNATGLKNVIAQLVQKYKETEDQLVVFSREHGIQITTRGAV